MDELLERVRGGAEGEHGSQYVAPRDDLGPHQGQQRLPSLRGIHLLDEKRNTDCRTLPEKGETNANVLVIRTQKLFVQRHIRASKTGIFHLLQSVR